MAIATDNLTSQLETLQITQWRLQAGLVTTLEAEQARGATEQTRAQLPALQTSIAQTAMPLRCCAASRRRRWRCCSIRPARCHRPPPTWP